MGQRILFYKSQVCSQQLNQIPMEDSLELPDDNQCINVQNLLSPEPMLKDSRENTPPHSLAYSNSTCVKDKLGDIQMRSPFPFESHHHPDAFSPNRTGVIKINNENHPVNNNQRTVSNSPQRMDEGKIETDRSRNKGKGKDKKGIHERLIIVKGPSVANKRETQHEVRKSLESREPDIEREQPRKTIVKNESSLLAARVKELQQALHIETVLSQQLRTKLSVTNKLLESKLKDSGIEYFLALKNSSRDLRNIDIFIEMNTLQKTLTEKMMIIDRQKGQLREANLQIQRLKQKKQAERSPTRKLNEQIEKLLEQKQSLISYIDQQKATLKRKIDYIAQLQSEINRMGDKQSHYTNIERPKLVTQIGDLRQENRRLNEELDTVRMEMNLLEINYKEEMKELKSKYEQSDKTLQQQQQELKIIKEQQQQNERQYKNASIQVQDIQRQILIKELDLLKSQRDHYLSEYRKRTSESARLYALQLKLSALQRSSLPIA